MFTDQNNSSVLEASSDDRFRIERSKIVMKNVNLRERENETMNVKNIIKDIVDNGHSTDVYYLYRHSFVNRK